MKRDAGKSLTGDAVANELDVLQVDQICESDTDVTCKKNGRGALLRRDWSARKIFPENSLTIYTLAVREVDGL